MEPLVIFIWVLLVFGAPLALAAACFVGYRRDVSAIRIIAGLPTSILVHLVLAYLTLFPMFFVLYAGAHSEPVGQVLSWPTRIVFLGIEVAYAFLVFSICTFLAGRAKPWPLKFNLP